MLKFALATCASLCPALPAAAQSPNNFLAGVRSIHVVMIGMAGTTRVAVR